MQPSYRTDGGKYAITLLNPTTVACRMDVRPYVEVFDPQAEQTLAVIWLEPAENSLVMRPVSVLRYADTVDLDLSSRDIKLAMYAAATAAMANRLAAWQEWLTQTGYTIYAEVEQDGNITLHAVHNDWEVPERCDTLVLTRPELLRMLAPADTRVYLP